MKYIAKLFYTAQFSPAVTKLFVREDFFKGYIIVDDTADLLTAEGKEIRREKYKNFGAGGYFIIEEEDGNNFLDFFGIYSSESRFKNHSCDPNMNSF